MNKSIGKNIEDIDTRLKTVNPLQENDTMFAYNRGPPRRPSKIDKESIPKPDVEKAHNNQEGEEQDSDPEPDCAEVERLKHRIVKEGFVPLIEITAYENEFKTFQPEGLLSPIIGEAGKNEFSFMCNENLFTPLPSTPSSNSDLDANIANIMKFLEEDTEDTKKRLEYEKKSRGIDWDNLEYQNSQTDYLADLSMSQNSDNEKTSSEL